MTRKLLLSGYCYVAARRVAANLGQVDDQRMVADNGDIIEAVAAELDEQGETGVSTWLEDTPDAWAGVILAYRTRGMQ